MASTRVIAVAAAALFALTACGSGPSTPTLATTAAAASAASASSSSPASPAPTPTFCPNGRLFNGDCAGGTEAPPSPAPPDPVGALVCPKIFKAQGTQAIYEDVDAMLAIGKQAATSSDSLIAAAGATLAEKAKAAKGKSDDLEATLNMGTAATKLETVCIQSGFKE